MTLLFVSFLSQVFAQDDWKKNKQNPRATEIWNPVPPKVTPGQTNSQAPSDAIVLFDGTDLSQWTNMKGEQASWTVEDGAMTVKPRTGSIMTKENFGDVQLHIEWRSPTELVGEGQGRGNSGVFLMNQFEVQVLDSYTSSTYSNGQAGSIYKQYVPLANATKAPGEWQTYDIIFTAPVHGSSGRIVHPATLTVIHNGVLIQNHVSLLGGTAYIGVPEYDGSTEGPIQLQDHGNLVSYRNIWVRKL
ncbi:MAG: DUF1080 domain-containing protein [Bacteroidota bacterium]